MNYTGCSFLRNKAACILFSRVESLHPSKQFEADEPAATLGHGLVSRQENKSVLSKDAFSGVTWRINISSGGPVTRAPTHTNTHLQIHVQDPAQLAVKT